MIRGGNRHRPPLTGLALLERDRNPPEAIKLKRGKSRKVICSKGTRKARYGGRGGFKPGGRWS